MISRFEWAHNAKGKVKLTVYADGAEPVHVGKWRDSRMVALTAAAKETA